MGQLDTVANWTKKIESALTVHFGAEGRGLHEKVTSVEHRLDRDLIRLIRRIATLRNKCMHEEGYELEDIGRFVSDCDSVYQRILALGETGHSAPTSNFERLQMFSNAGHMAADLKMRAVEERSLGRLVLREVTELISPIFWLSSLTKLWDVGKSIFLFALSAAIFYWVYNWLFTGVPSSWWLVLQIPLAIGGLLIAIGWLVRSVEKSTLPANPNAQGFWMVRDYALRSPLARHYFLLIFVLVVNILFIFGPEVADYIGEPPQKPMGKGDEYLVFWNIFSTAIAGYLLSRIGLVKEGVNLTPVLPGFLWFVASVLVMVVLHGNMDLMREYAQLEIFKTTRNYGSDPLFSMPVVAMEVVTGLQIIGLLLFSMADIRAAFSGMPVPMNLPEDVAPTKALNPVVTPTVPKAQTDLSTRDTDALRPKLTFDDLAGNEELKAKLWDAAEEWHYKGKKNGKNGIFLYGEPGTGKTAFAEALAGEAKLKIMKVNVGSMASRFINQTTQQLQDIIDSALRQAPCVLFIDEFETVCPDRNRIERGDSEEAKVVDTFLSAVEKLRDGRVLLIAATNYKDRVDPAAIRGGRFDFHIEVTVPDSEARKGLILNALTKLGKTVEPAVLDRLVRRWSGFNVPRIQQAAEKAAGFAPSQTVEMHDFMRGLREVQGHNTGVPESALGLSDLHFDDDLRARLSKLAATFARSDEIESIGAKVDKNVIFYGPPGTGKTTMAQALAKEAGWTFIATSGKEILSDTNKLHDICRKASDLRPAIVFIDEADDILGHRQFSGMKLHTNELLSTISGAGGPLYDVSWILATNDIDGLDEAVTRRFPVKIELPVPRLATLTRLVLDWASKRPEMIHGDIEEWSQRVATSLKGAAPSVVYGILDSALNTEAANSVLHGEAMTLTIEKVMEAKREMRA